jgi:hypothetical protein
VPLKTLAGRRHNSGGTRVAITVIADMNREVLYRHVCERKDVTLLLRELWILLVSYLVKEKVVVV